MYMVAAMIRITVISDTHRDFDTLYDIVKQNIYSDMFIHLGDGEREFDDVRNIYPEKAFLFVRGNNDWSDSPIYRTFTYGGHKFYLTHGHSFSRDSIQSFLAATAKANNCDIALFGHTHIPFYNLIDNVHVFNPGSPSHPRGLSQCSYGIITISDNGNVKFEHKTYEN